MKVKDNLELNLARRVKRNKKWILQVHHQTKERGETMDFLCCLERPALSNSFLATRRKVKTNSPAVGEDQSREHLNKLDILTSTGPERLHIFTVLVISCWSSLDSKAGKPPLQSTKT